MADSNLLDFVHDALRSGVSRGEIERVSLEAGWTREQVAGALAVYAAIDFPIPVPRPKRQLSARDAFFYLLLFAMLYVSAYNLGKLLFQFINLAFPDPLAMGGAPMVAHERSIGERIRWATSSLIVAFPVFVFLTYRIAKSIENEPQLRASAVRRWLTYLTLAAAACIIVGDLIALLNGLLSGALTVRFILKALCVGVIAGTVFGYYLSAMRRDEELLRQ